MDFSLFINSTWEWQFLSDLVGYTLSNTPLGSLDDSIVYLGCIGIKWKSRGICTTKDITDQSITQELPNKDITDQSITLELPNKKQLVLSDSFIEWFRGFTDAEGCFSITKIKGINAFRFDFRISLHIDDLAVIEYIHNTLGFGRTNKGEFATFNVGTHKDVAVIIAIFSKYSLNTPKHLDFLAFSRAYELYMKNSETRHEMKAEIEKIQTEMNSTRTDFYLPLSHFKITSNWLLGFAEGDGSFSHEINNRSFVFVIVQKGNKDLFDAILSFLHNLALVKLGSEVENSNDVGHIYPSNRGNKWNIVVKRRIIIEKVLIPLFDGLTWHTKKYLDYCDWKTILNLWNMGLHYLPEGKALILRITKQMNSYRLTSSGHPKIDRSLLEADITKLVSGPSNYEIREGKTFIKSLNRYVKEISPNGPIAVQLVDLQTGNIISTFDSFNDCAKFLDSNRTTVSRRSARNNQFEHKGKLVYLQKVPVPAEE